MQKSRFGLFVWITLQYELQKDGLMIESKKMGQSENVKVDFNFGDN